MPIMLQRTFPVRTPENLHMKIIITLPIFRVSVKVRLLADQCGLFHEASFYA